MKTYTGRSPNRDRKQIGNSDCRFLSGDGKNIVDLCGKYVHAIREGDNIGAGRNIRPDTMYLLPNVTFIPNIVSKVDLTYDNSFPDFYDGLFYHLNGDRSGNCYNLMFVLDMDAVDGFDSYLTKAGESIDCIQITLNDMSIGYYLPTLNSWVIGNWIWHEHYISNVMKYLWPILVDRIGLRPCSNSIFGGPKKQKEKIAVKIGADPEFELKKNNRVIRASGVINTRDSCVDQIGLDGAGDQVEIRPDPGTPGEVVRSMRNLIRKFSEDYPDMDLTDDGGIYPLGGHIHVGLGSNIDIPRDLVTILDDFIGKPTIDTSGKARGGYKGLSAVRSQPHGFEYRSTPAAVFQNPNITFITCKIMKNLCEHYFNEEVIEYSDVPTVADYMKWGGLTKKQAETFINFEKNYKPQSSIRASWKVSPARVDEVRVFVPEIEFRDEWDPSIRDHICATIMDQVKTEFPVKISLYGLHKDRGSQTCTMEIRDTNVSRDVPKPIWESRGTNHQLNIGFSKDLRVYGLGNSRVTSLTRNIIATIRQKSGQI